MQDAHLLGTESERHEGPIFVAGLVLNGEPDIVLFVSFSFCLFCFVCFFVSDLSGKKEVGSGQWQGSMCIPA